MPRAALPRLRGQGDVHARRLQLAPRRAAGRDPARAAAAASTAGTTAASPSPRATRSSGSASTSCCRRSPPGARHIYHLYVVRSQERERLRRRARARPASRSRLYYTTPLHLQPVFAHLGYARGLAPRDRALRARMPRAADVADARRGAAARGRARRHGPGSRQNVDFKPYGAVEPPPAVAGRRRRGAGRRRLVRHLRRRVPDPAQSRAGTRTGSRRSRSSS